jgi:hypothetical protein
LNTYRCSRLYLDCSLQNFQEFVHNIKIPLKNYKKSRKISIRSPYLILESPNHREYKNAFVLQDVNIKMHKITVLKCSATLNRLEITTTD